MKNGSYSFGKVILIGEHAVVYNNPAIAFPLFNLSTKAIITNSDEFMIVSKYGTSTCHEKIREHEGIMKIIQVFREKHLKIKNFPNFKITIESNIPSGGGLGSSAALSKAVTEALTKYFEKDLSLKQKFNLIQVGEKIHHNNPSGLDAQTVLWERAIYFQKKRKTKRIKIDFKGYFVIADTGLESRTIEAISIVREFKKNHELAFKKSLKDFKKVAKDGKKALTTNDFALLAKAISNNQILLESIGVSDIALKKLIDIALLNGASAAKLTGGGLGGSMIALAKNEEIAKTISQSLSKNGAETVFILNIGETK